MGAVFSFTPHSRAHSAPVLAPSRTLDNPSHCAVSSLPTEDATAGRRALRRLINYSTMLYCLSRGAIGCCTCAVIRSDYTRSEVRRTNAPKPLGLASRGCLFYYITKHDVCQYVFLLVVQFASYCIILTIEKQLTTRRNKA